MSTPKSVEFPLFKHQKTTVDFLLEQPRALITSDAGTGKTRCVLEAFKQSAAKRLLVWRRYPS